MTTRHVAPGEKHSLTWDEIVSLPMGAVIGIRTADRAYALRRTPEDTVRLVIRGTGVQWYRGCVWNGLRKGETMFFIGSLEEVIRKDDDRDEDAYQVRTAPVESITVLTIAS
ncbi:MAG: hypothetical protein RLZZ324_794 [Candidatus Parcubacteria bacterium]|jgi:hypothetical protein